MIEHQFDFDVLKVSPLCIIDFDVKKVYKNGGFLFSYQPSLVLKTELGDQNDCMTSRFGE